VLDVSWSLDRSAEDEMRGSKEAHLMTKPNCFTDLIEGDVFVVVGKDVLITGFDAEDDVFDAGLSHFFIEFVVRRINACVENPKLEIITVADDVIHYLHGS